MNKIGIIGIGMMGQAITRRLLDSGLEVFVSDVNDAAIDRATSWGASAVESPRAMADTVDMCLVIVRNDEQLLEVMTEPTSGYVASATARNLVVVASSVDPRTVRQVATALAATGTRLLDCPVSGGVEGALAGTLTLMAAGEPEVVRECQPVLERLGDNIVIVGHDVGLGQTMKAVNQGVYFTNLAATAEALMVGVKSGLDPEAIVRVLSKSSGSNWALENRIPLAWTSEYISGGSVDIAIKDMNTLYTIAREHDCVTSVLNTAQALWRLTGTLNAAADDPQMVATMELLSDCSISNQTNQIAYPPHNSAILPCSEEQHNE